MGRIDGKVALVTGAARGLGAAIARRLAEEGAAVVLTDVLVNEGRATAETIPGAVFLEQDVSDEARWQAVLAEVQDRFGSLHVLVNNAGAVRIATIEDATLDDFHFHQRVLLDGGFLGCKYGLPLITTSGGGAIINITALAGVRGVGNLPAYSTMKAGLAGLTRSLAVFCMEKGYPVRVNAIAAGAHDTPMARLGMANADAATTRIIEAGLADAVDIANTVLFLASEEGRNVNGQELVVDGGSSAR
ncbi:SDR family NAD(P)-dependent oxidoreductase [Nocardia vinacea]|uniref:SDR family NAD(P)-dependent oxidoreductase n=1 Tax=Nocardia vinacea TaxID=96468 RepID=UPI0003040F2C|nr:SDR family oxidoreductase [Nocardia vinacea]